MINLYRKVALAGAATMVAIATNLAGFTKSAAAQSVAICQSVDYQQATCALDTRGGVILEREYSDSSCAGNWGYGNGYVWVDNGCRAKFKVGRDWDSYDDRDDRDDEYSRDDRYERQQYCRSECREY